ncbi:MAG: HAD family phosphatase [Candidatus Bathyarchaeota archaeon]|nr:HAD family phosphatase [Candidatus Bathyarchaeota archaeon]
MRKFKAVIFDWDGTLADTRKAIMESFRKVLSEVDCTVSDEFIERRIGVGTRRVFEDVLRECGITVDDEALEKLVERKIEFQTELTGNVNLFEGAVELLDALHGRGRIALATMGPRKVVEKLLSEKSIRGCFDAVVTAEDVLNPKPDPEIFLQTARKMKLRPEDCLVMEDSIFGVKAAKAAEMGCIAIPSGAYTGEELRKENPDLVVKSLNEKEKILKFVFEKKTR